MSQPPIASTDLRPALDDARILAADWATIWQSELAALAADRECGEHLAGLLQSWFTANAAMASQGRGRDAEPAPPRPEPAGADGLSRADASARSPPAAAAPHDGGAVERLERRIGALERRLDGVVARPGAAGGTAAVGSIAV